MRAYYKSLRVNPLSVFRRWDVCPDLRRRTFGTSDATRRVLLCKAALELRGRRLTNDNCGACRLRRRASSGGSMNVPRGSIAIHAVLAGLSLLAAGSALADPFVLATGRRDPRIYAIDLK